MADNACADPSPKAPARWQAIVFGSMALIACIATFVGLSRSGFWIDELFTIYLIKHNGGISEVIRRQLTDTHPPFYPIVLHLWTRLAGFSERSLRLPSAVFAVLAIAIFALGSRRVLSVTAIAFACAVATMSDFWFYQSQNARSYTLSMVMAAAMLSAAIAFRRRVRVNMRFPTSHWLALSALGMIASLTHAYLLLALGMILFALILTTRSWPVRVALVATGLAVLAVNIVYYRMLMHSSAQDLHNMWFDNNMRFFYRETRQALSLLIAGQVSIVVTLLVLLQVRQWFIGERAYAADDLDTRWTCWLAVFVLLGVMVCGVGVSLEVAPSYSDRNLLTCSPFAWLLIGRLYDAVGPKGYTRRSCIAAALIIVTIGYCLRLLSGRELPRTESWRGSSDYVQQLPGCAGQPLPVMLPYHFGHDSPHFRSLAEQSFFGYYMPPGAQIDAYMPAELAARHPTAGLPALLASRASNVDSSGCAMLAWAVHDVDENRALKIGLDLARQPGIAPHRVLMQEFNTYVRQRLRWKLSWQTNPEAYVYVAIPQASANSTQKAPPLPNIHLTGPDAHVLGDSVVIAYLSTYRGDAKTPYLVDTYAIERWDGKTLHDDFLAVQRLSCDPPVTKANWDVWPNPTYPGCSPLATPTIAGEVKGGL